MLMMLILLLLLDLGLIGTATTPLQQEQTATLGGESGIEESEGEEDEEWIYNKPEEKLQSELGAVEKNIEAATAPIIEEDIVLEEPPTAPISEQVEQFDFNLPASDPITIEAQEIEKVENIEEIAPQEAIESVKFETESYEEEQKENINPEEVETNFEQLELATADDMESQLNPDAKEFIPVSPVSRSQEFSSPPPSENGFERPLANPILGSFDDAVVSQSPRKGELIMEDVSIPDTENEFDQEADARPHEVNLMEENFHRIDSPSAKEAMQIDEKLEQSYSADDSQHFEEETKQQKEDYKVLEKSFEEYSNGFQSKIDDAMNRSFYEGRDGDILANNDLLNTVQPIPSFEDEQPEADHHQNNFVAVESDKPEADLMGTFELPQKTEDILQKIDEVSQEMIESSDTFEAEHFVEAIKGVSESKYVDTELSPTVDDFTHQNNFQSSSPSSMPPVVEETIVRHTSFKDNLAEMNLDTMIIETSKTDILEPPPTEAVDIELPPTEFKDIPETVEPVVEDVIQPTVVVQEKKEATKIEEPKSEVIVPEAKKEKVAEVKKAPITKKPLPISKAPVKATEVKKAEVKPRTVGKPTSAAASSKPLAPKVSTVKAPASATTTRPAPTKTAPLTAAAVKKTLNTVAAARTISKPPTAAAKPSTTTSTVPAKRPVTSASTTRPAPKPAVSKVANGSATSAEKKPLVSSAPAARAAPKPTTLTVKSKLTNGTSAVSPRSASATSPLKEKALNKPTSMTSTLKSPRPATTTAAVKSLTAKSPSTTTVTAPKTLGAVGTRKPLTITKKSPVEKTSTTTTSSTITKKSPGSASAKSIVPSKTMKKTTTTVVTKKKVVNGDIVMEEVETTTKTTNDEINGGGDTTNGVHLNGNGLLEIGGSEQQAVIEPAGI